MRNCAEFVKRKLVWNYFIRITLETALEVLIASMIRSYSLNFSDWAESLSTVFAVSSTVILVLAIGAIPCFLYKRRDILRRKKFQEKYGSLVLDLKTKQMAPLFYQSFFLARRVLLASLIVYADKYPNAQIMSNTLACVFQMMYIGLV